MFTSCRTKKWTVKNRTVVLNEDRHCIDVTYEDNQGCRLVTPPLDSWSIGKKIARQVAKHGPHAVRGSYKDASMWKFFCMESGEGIRPRTATWVSTGWFKGYYQF